MVGAEMNAKLSSRTTQNHAAMISLQIFTMKSSAYLILFRDLSPGATACSTPQTSHDRLNITTTFASLQPAVYQPAHENLSLDESSLDEASQQKDDRISIAA